jgi:hypothetical protein
VKKEPTPTNLNLACIPFEVAGNPVNHPEFILEPNALITGSEYFRTAFEDKLDRVSPIDCGIALGKTNKKINKISESCFEILFIDSVKKYFINLFAIYEVIESKIIPFA